MALRSDTRKMYSWWWDSHISPKNSKWLQENLTDMDSRVRIMIKLIEVDEDSFARRAEMYYKKRPELMKLVEEFYRAYRALAERYDHATGIIRQAHRTMTEVFPNQIPFSLADDGGPPPGSGHDSDPQTPELLPPIRAPPSDPDELHGDPTGLSPPDIYAGKRNAILSKDLELAGRKGLKQLSNFLGAEGRVRKGLSFHDADETHHLKAHGVSEESEANVEALKEALVKLEAEKLAGVVEYRQSLERLSKLESEVTLAQENSNAYSERARKAEAEVSTLKEALARLEAEREASLIQYEQCLERVSNLEASVSSGQQDAAQLCDRACKAEKEAEDLREELAQLKDEKEADLSKYLDALGKLTNLENRLLLAEHDARMASERADNAEKEVEALRAAIAELKEEKEAIALQHQLCLEEIANLEHEIVRSQGEAERLKGEIDAGVTKLKGVEEQYLLLESSNKSMQQELDSLFLKVGSQNEALSEKQKELGRLWACIQEERLRFAEAETAFQALQNLHSQTQEELRSAAAELQKRVQLLKEMEIQNKKLSLEIENSRDENESLKEVNISSALSIKTMQEEILNLRRGKEKLEDELELTLGQSNALQQEIYSLKEEISDLSERHGAVLDQMGSVGLNPESFVLSVRELQDENLKLKGSCQRNEDEIIALLEKLAMMENLVEKNTTLENSLSNLSVELQGAREKVRELEDSFLLLLEEKSTILSEKNTLISQLAVTTENLEKLSERNTCLENSLCDANAELEALRAKSKKLEESCRLLSDEKSILASERHTLSLQLQTSHRSLEELEKQHAELEKKYSLLEEEREAAVRIMEELRASLDTEKQEHANSIQLSQMQMTGMEKQIHSLQEAGQRMREELEAELDKAVNAQFEIFILRKYVQDLKDKNSSLLIKFEKVLEAFQLTEKLISGLERENLEQQLEVRLLTDQIKRLRMGMFQLCKALEVDAGLECKDITYRDQMVLQNVLSKLDDTKRSLSKAWDEHQTLVIEKSVLVALLEQLKHEVADWKAVVNMLSLEFKAGNEKLAFLQNDMQKLLQSNEELILRVREGNHREELHATEIENLRGRLADSQLAYQNLERANHSILEENGALLNAIANLKQEKHKLERENSHLFGETVALDSIAVIFKTIILEKSVDIKELTDNIDQLYNANNSLEVKLRSTEENLELADMEKTSVELCLLGTENELREVTAAKGQLATEIQQAKSTLSQKERELLGAEATIDSQGKQIFELSHKYDQQVKDCQLLQESVHNLDAEISRINKQHEDARGALEALSMDLQKGRDEVELWETMSATLFGELQSSSVREMLFREKLFELSKTYENLADENHFKGVEVVELTEKVGKLEDENGQMKAQLDAYSPAIASLRECVTSLENHTIVQSQIGNEEKKDAERSLKHGEPEKIADLKDVQTRIKAVEKAVVEMKRIAEEDSYSSNTKLEATMKQIETLKAQNSSRRASSRSSRRLLSHEEISSGTSDGWRQRRLGPDAYEVGGDELRMKDIMLDQASESSFYGRHRREISKADDDTLELWETIEKGGSIDLTVGRSQKAAEVSPKKKRSPFEALKDQKSRRPSTESSVEKEMCIDQQDISKRFSDPPHEENQKKILERLDSDLQKLNNLQITVQDLKKKVQAMDYSGKGKGAEYDTAKEQLVEAEKAILKLLDVNGRLAKNVEVTLSSFDSLSTVESSEGGGSARRRKVWEQARKCSEKIGKLQLEVQKMQFLLLKLDADGKAGKGGTRAAERNTRVLLRDYLYGGLRTPRRRKKVRFCACVQPPTKGD
ncbi:hypothetical protein Dimus_016882 [Dionaea muscipula]